MTKITAEIEAAIILKENPEISQAELQRMIAELLFDSIVLSDDMHSIEATNGWSVSQDSNCISSMKKIAFIDEGISDEPTFKGEFSIEFEEDGISTECDFGHIPHKTHNFYCKVYFGVLEKTEENALKNSFEQATKQSEVINTPSPGLQ